MKAFWMCSLLLVAVAISGFGLAYSKHQSRKLFGDIDLLRAKQTALELEWQRLRFLQSRRSALVKVDEKARTELDMYVPGPGDVIYLSP